MVRSVSGAFGGRAAARQLTRMVGVAVTALAGLNLAGLAVLMALRARYPYELEWIESATVDSVRWILAGHFLYERPSLEFTPLLYNPLHFYLSAALAVLTGPGFLAPRAISALATAGCCALIFLLIEKETGDRAAALVAAGFYAATFQVTGLWMDIARSDSLLMFFLLLSAYWARRAPGVRGALLTAFGLTLAYYSKQSALPFFVAFGAYYLLESRPGWLTFWPASALLMAGSAWLINRLSGGWYSFYTWYIVRQHVLDAERIRAFWQMDMLGHVPLALAGGLVALLLLGNPLGRLRSRFFLAFTAGAFAAGWLNRAAAGAHTNTLMPVMASLAILLGLLLGLESPPKLGGAFRPAALLLVGAQFVMLAYDPRSALPTARDRQAGDALLALIRSYPGDVFVPYHSYYPALVGKPTFAHWATITDTSGLWDTDLDVQKGGQHDPRRRIILDELEAAIAGQRFSAIILDDLPKEKSAYWDALLAPYYRLERTAFTEPDVFWTVAGAPTRPQLVYAESTFSVPR